MSNFKTTWLTGLRGLACLSVIFYHVNQHRSVENLSEISWNIYQFTDTFTIAVSFFFILSGIYRSMPYWRTILLWEPSPETKKSLADRFFRIAPAYYVALTASFILAYILGDLSNDVFVRLLSGFTFLSWIHPTTFFPVDLNGPLWFISYDMMGTFIVMGTMLFLTRIPKKHIPLWLIGTAWLLLCLHFLFIRLPFPSGWGIAGEWFPVYNPFLFGLYFLIGAVIGGGYVMGEKNNRISALKYDCVAIIAFLSIFVFLWFIRGVHDFDYAWPRGPYRFPVVPVLMAIIMFTLPYSLRVGKWLDNKALSWVAKISFGMYLWHALVIVIIHRFLFWNKPLLLNEWFVFLSISLICSFGISWLSYTYLEMGFGEWRKHRIVQKSKKLRLRQEFEESLEKGTTEAIRTPVSIL